MERRISASGQHKRRFPQDFLAFLLNDVPPEDLVQGVRHVAAGDALLSPRVTRRLIPQFASSRPARNGRPDARGLTPRELEGLALVAPRPATTATPRAP